MPGISLEKANQIIAAALAKGSELGLKPLSVVVVDAGEHPVAFARQDGASNLRFAIAVGKACGALALGMSSRKIAEAAAERPSFIASVASISLHGIVPAAGGVIIVDEQGRPAAAVGITGDSSDNDEICALHAVAAVGLTVQS